MILKTLQAAGAAALDDVELFKSAIETVDGNNPFITRHDVRLSWTGQSYFDQPRPVNVPMVITEYQNPDFKTIHIGTVERWSGGWPRRAESFGLQKRISSRQSSYLSTLDHDDGRYDSGHHSRTGGQCRLGA